MNNRNEISEIMQFIKAFHLPKSNLDTKFCLEQMTKSIDEAFLMERASDIREAYESDFEFKTQLSYLSSICNETEKFCEDCPVRKYCNSYISAARAAVNVKSLKMVDLL